MHNLSLRAFVCNATIVAYLHLPCNGQQVWAKQHILGSETTVDGPFDKAFDEFVEDTLAIFHVPGLSVAVVDGEHTYSKVTTK